MKRNSNILILFTLAFLGMVSCNKMDTLQEKSSCNESSEVQELRVNSSTEDSEEDSITDPDHDEEHDMDDAVSNKL